MEQAQSYYSLLMRGRYTAYEVRIMLKIVESTREIVNTRGKYSDFLKSGFSLDNFNLNYAIPIKDIIGSKTHNYKPIYAAVEKLKHWDIEYYDKEAKKWYSTTMIYNIILEEGSGLLRFSCSKWLIDYITDFRNGGFRVYDFEAAMKLRNPFSARLYMLCSSMSKKIRYQMQGLREVLGIRNKFKLTADLERRVLKRAQKDMEALGINGFNYEIIRENPKNPRSKPLYIDISPVKRQKKERNIGEQLAEAKKEIPELLYNYLTVQLGFSGSEMVWNKQTICNFIKIGDWQTRLQNIVTRARRGRKGHGYIIQGLKDEYAAALEEGKV